MNASLREPHPPIGTTWTMSPARRLIRTLVGGVFLAALSAPVALAQSSPATWHGLSDRFQIDTGYFGLTASTVLRYSGPEGNGAGQPRAGPGPERPGQHILGGLDVAGGPASPAQARLHPVQSRPARLHAPARLHVGRGDLPSRAECEHEQQERHPRGLLPVRGLPQRPLRDRSHHRHRVPEARGENPDDRHGERPGGSESRTLDEGASAGQPDRRRGRLREVGRPGGSWCAATSCTSR